MIKLTDLLKEAISDPLTVFKDRLEMGIFSWDKHRKKAGLDFLRVVLPKAGDSGEGKKQGDSLDILAKGLFKDEQGKGIPYSKLTYQQRVVCVKKAFENITDIKSAIAALKQLRVGRATSSAEQLYIDSFIRYLEQADTDSQEGSVKEPLAEAKKKEESKLGAFEEFAEIRYNGAEKIAKNAKEKGGLAMLTYNHFIVKLPYYNKANEGKFDIAEGKKEFEKILKNISLNMTQTEFQREVGRLEVLGELIIKANK
jgi:hypothetical protein